MSHASLERQLLAAQTAKLELETKLREKELLVERLEKDRRWFSDREKEEREEKEHERELHDEAKVGGTILQPLSTDPSLSGKLTRRTVR